MTTAKFDNINEALNIEPEVVETTIKKFEETKDILDKLSKTDMAKDYEYARAQLYSLISKGQESINTIMEIAQEGGSPRSFEVVGQLLKIVADITDKLLDTQKKMVDLEQPTSGGTTNVTNNNALFVGSTAELQKLIKDGLLNNKEDS